MRKLSGLLIALFLIGFSLSASAETIIYKESRDSMWLPATYVINGTFDVVQNPYWFSQKDYSEKLSIVWKRVRRPNENIKKDGGYKKFFQDEFFSSRVLPNIGLHFLGGAYDTLWLTEYFRHYNYPAPRFWAFLMTYAAHFGNEALEVSSSEISSHDHIADIYVFDLAAFFLASSPTAMKYLVDDMGMKAWPFNPMFDIDSEDFFNTGLNYVFRPKIAHMLDGKLKPLYFLGMQTMAGASYRYNPTSDLTVAMGISLTNPLKQKGRFVTGLFHETDGELDASLFLNGSEDFRWRVNLYENLLRKFVKNKKPWNLSLVLGQAKGPSYAIGLNVNLPFGLAGIKNKKPKPLF